MGPNWAAAGYMTIENAIKSSAGIVSRRLDRIREVRLRMNSVSHRRSTLDPIVIRKMKRSVKP